MDGSKDIAAGKETDNSTNIEEAKRNIFSFKSMQIEDSINPEEQHSAVYKDSLKVTGGNARDFKPPPNMNPRSRIVASSKRLRDTFQNKEEETESSLRGNWTLYCNPNPDSNGNSEAIEILKSAQELHKTRPNLFPIPPFSCEKQNGAVVVCCYTPDYTDKDFNLRVARVIRKEIRYPYVMYYHKRIGNLTSFYMHTPDDEFYVNIEGQWILEE